MGRGVVVAVLALLGLLCAAGMGYASYLVSRGSVAVPVTRLQPRPQQLTPAQVRAKPKLVRKPVTTRATTTTRGTTSGQTTTVDDHGGRRGSSGGDNSGHGGGSAGSHSEDD